MCRGIAFAANRLQTTTVKTTWHDASTEPTNPATEIFRSSTHSHSVVNGHAHAQVINIHCALEQTNKKHTQKSFLNV